MSEHNDALPGERYDDAPAPPRISRRHGALMIGLAGLCAAGYFAFHSVGEDKAKAGSNQPTSISQIASFEPVKTDPVNAQKATTTPPPAMHQTLAQDAPPAEDPLAKARLAPLVIGPTPRRSGRPSQQLSPAPRCQVRAASPS